jgi:hypothetical protein
MFLRDLHVGSAAEHAGLAMLLVLVRHLKQSFIALKSTDRAPRFREPLISLQAPKT